MFYKKIVLLILAAVFFLAGMADLTEAANIKVVPSATRVSPGENFYIDIVVENIPSEGLGAIQFRLNVDAPGSEIVGVSNTAQAGAGNISVVTPLIIGPPTSGRSGIGEFFWNATGPHGILVMDNENPPSPPFDKGGQGGFSGLYTFGHTNGSTPPSGSGSVSRFYFTVGKDVAAERISITFSEVMLLDAGTVYPLESNIGAIIELRCITKVPDLLGLSQYDAQAALQKAGLLTGEIYEIDNTSGNYALNKVLAQSYAAGTSVLCETPVDLAINTAPSEVSNANAVDKANDESGTVILSWIPSSSPDTAGYRVYLISGSQNLLKEIRNPASTGVEITGLTNGQVLQLKITAFDNFGNESQGVIISATPVDDVAPRITISGVSEGAFYSSDVLPVIDVQDANLSTKEITLNNIPYNMAAISLEGNYILMVRATDASGNSTTKEIRFVIDKTPPVISVTGIEKDRYYNIDVSPVITVTDSNLQKVESFLNGNPYTSGSTITAEGTYQLKIEAADKAGNSSSDTYIFYIDKTKPTSSIATGEPKLESNGSIFITVSTSFTLTGKDEGSVVSGLDRLEYRINNGVWNTYQMSFMLSGINDGIITIEYRAADRAGNIEDFHTLTVNSDNTPPVSTINAGTPQYQTNGTLYISGSTEISISATDSGSGLNNTKYSIDGSSFTTYTGPITLASYADGTHTITYRSIDNIGNIEDAKTLILVLDKTPPVTSVTASDQLIEGVINTVSPKTKFTLSATDNLSGVKEIRYSIDGGAWQTYMANFSLSGLAAGMHAIAYKATDNVLNEETEKAITLTLIVIDVSKNIVVEPAVLVGVWANNNSADLEQKQADINTLNAILTTLRINYYMALSTDDFTAALRSGRYNTYLLIDFKEPLVGEEIREAVHSGNGLIFIKTSPEADPFMGDVFGVKFTGKTTSSDLTVNLTESPLSSEAVIQSNGKNVVATINSDSAQSFGYVMDKHDTYSSVVYNQYEKGKVILYNFDLLYAQDQVKVKELILNSINLVMPLENSPAALASMPINIKLSNSEEPVDVKVIETIPYGATYDTVTPQTLETTENAITWQKYLNMMEKASFRYYLNLPDSKGDYILNTEVRYNNNGEYRLYGNYPLTLSIQSNSVGLQQMTIAYLGSISSANPADAGKISNAVNDLLALNQNAVSRKNAEQNIRLITNAINEIRKLSFNASDIRLKLDELLKIWEMKWYLL